ncbi:hypothetical protein SK128_020744 [Halocaridina rubra]|uniref:Uncharacterized protein n=1 Tax=Halocaridina rubra TaxID=373956 RepID=A0AAN8WFZ7_HALRR
MASILIGPRNALGSTIHPTKLTVYSLNKGEWWSSPKCSRGEKKGICHTTLSPVTSQGEVKLWNAVLWQFLALVTSLLEVWRVIPSFPLAHSNGSLMTSSRERQNIAPESTNDLDFPLVHLLHTDLGSRGSSLVDGASWEVASMKNAASISLRDVWDGI